MKIVDQLPHVFQADIDRFYKRIILATLSQIPLHGMLTVGRASTMDEFLKRCAAQVDNYIANEAAKAFALTLDGMFQRQLSRWADGHGMNENSWDGLLKACASIASLDLVTAGMADPLRELHLVANVARHGDGRSCMELKLTAPQLWNSSLLDYHNLTPGPVPISDEIRIQSHDLRRYVRAIVQFWGYADPLPTAVRDPPY